MITFTQGDDITLNLTAMMGNGALVDLTGASFSSQFRGVGNTIVTFPNSQHTANPDQVGHKGQFTLALTTANTNSIGSGYNREIVTQITIGGGVVYFRGTAQVIVYPTAPMP